MTEKIKRYRKPKTEKPFTSLDYLKNEKEINTKRKENDKRIMNIEKLFKRR